MGEFGTVDWGRTAASREYPYTDADGALDDEYMHASPGAADEALLLGEAARGLGAADHELLARFATVLHARDSRAALAAQFLRVLDASVGATSARALDGVSAISEAHMEITKLPTAFYVAELVHNAIGLAIVALLALVLYEVL
jgi:hypothetical protein